MFAIESVMDQLVHRLGFDLLAFRLRNEPTWTRSSASRSRPGHCGRACLRAPGSSDGSTATRSGVDAYRVGSARLGNGGGRASSSCNDALRAGIVSRGHDDDAPRPTRSGKKTTAQIASLSRRGVFARGVLVPPVTPHMNPGSPVAAVAWEGVARANNTMPARALMTAAVRRFGP